MEFIYNKKGRTLRNSGDQGLTQFLVVVARTLMDCATFFHFLPSFDGYKWNLEIPDYF